MSKVTCKKNKYKTVFGSYIFVISAIEDIRMITKINIVKVLDEPSIDRKGKV